MKSHSSNIFHPHFLGEHPGVGAPPGPLEHRLQCCSTPAGEGRFRCAAGGGPAQSHSDNEAGRKSRRRSDGWNGDERSRSAAVDFRKTSGCCSWNHLKGSSFTLRQAIICNIFHRLPSWRPRRWRRNRTCPVVTWRMGSRLVVMSMPPKWSSMVKILMGFNGAFHSHGESPIWLVYKNGTSENHMDDNYVLPPWLRRLRKLPDGKIMINID